MKTKNLKTKKPLMSKRALASAFRKGAANLDKYGWIEGEMGDTSYGFCAMGALENVLGLDDIQSHRFFGGRNVKAGGILRTLDVAKNTKSTVFTTIVKWNDHHVAKTCKTGKDVYGYDEHNRELGGKIVASTFRKIARMLEHGGVL